MRFDNDNIKRDYSTREMSFLVQSQVFFFFLFVLSENNYCTECFQSGNRLLNFQRYLFFKKIILKNKASHVFTVPNVIAANAAPKVLELYQFHSLIQNIHLLQTYSSESAAYVSD